MLISKRFFTGLMLSSLFSFNISAGEIDNMLSEMTLEQKVGQMLLVGFRGFTAEEGSQIVRDLSEYHIGSVILFDRDVALGSNERNIKTTEQVKNLNEQLQSYSDIPLLISIDQEGGFVTRLKPQHGFRANTPSHQRLGEEGLETTLNASEVLGRNLSELGINLNFAPVVDLNVNPRNPIIGRFQRSFSDDPNSVTAHAAEFIRGHELNRVGAVLKHFPGHGSSENDSHVGFTDVTHTWSDVELKPFKELIEKGKADFIMTAHVFNRHLDSEVPATLSKRVIDGILRNELGFDGVIISDDMNMGAIKDHFDHSESVVMAINAGVDILLFGNNLEFDENIIPTVHSIIMTAIEDGKISIERIEESARRVLKFKQKIDLI